MAYPCGFARVGHSFGLCYAERFETALWPGRPAFHHFLLLSPAALSANGSRETSVPENPGRSAKQISVPADWVRHHAGACAFADQRAEARERVARLAGVEAARFANDARKEEARFERSTFAEVRRCDDGGAAFLAAAVLRLQCVE